MVVIGFDGNNGSSQVYTGTVNNLQFTLDMELQGSNSWIGITISLDVLLHSSTFTPKGAQILIGEIQNFTGSYGIMIRNEQSYEYDDTVFSGNVAFVNENFGYAIGHGVSTSLHF